jgi:hypothetical protein
LLFPLGEASAPTSPVLINARQGVLTKDFNGHALTFREDGWFNMTKAASSYGRRIQDFFRLVPTVEYLEAMEKVGISHLYTSAPGRHGGTWAHPKLAVFFARWLDVKFAV